MTNHLPFIVNLKNLLPVSTWSWVFPALTQDRYVWKSLGDPSFAGLALDKIGANPSNWTPANLGLIQLDLPPHKEHSSINAEIRDRALTTYESFLDGRSEEQLKDQILELGLLLAIALLEHQRMSDSWSTVSTDLNPIPQKVWSTVLACLYGLVPDKPAFLSGLLSFDSSPFFRKAGIHAFLSNPQPPSLQSNILQDVLASVPMPEWVPTLQHLESNRPELAAELANHLLTKQPTFANRKKYPQNSEQVKHLSRLMALSELQRMAGEKEQGKTLHALALGAVEDLHMQLNSQTIDVVINTGNLDEAIKQWENQGFSHPALKSANHGKPPDSLILSLLEENRTSDALDLILSMESEPSAPYPAYQLVKAHQSASEGDLITARKAAKQALIDLVVQIDEANNGSGPESQFDQKESRDTDNQQLIENIAKTLIDLDIPQQGLEAAQILADLNPNNAEVLKTLAVAQTALGDTSNAVANAHLAAALNEDSWDYRQQLALSLQAANRWEEALDEWQSLLNDRFPPEFNENLPPISALHSLANCAIKAGNYDLAKDTCQRVLDQNPQDGIAHALLGETLSCQGDVENALAHYQQGIELSPHLAAPWLKQAQAQKEKGLPGNALDTLRQASQAVPDDPLVHLTLAETYLEENSLTQALTTLQHAQGLVTQPLLVSQTNPWDLRKDKNQNIARISKSLPCSIALCLGETLRLLGHLGDARQILEDGYRDYPSSVDLARVYAKTLISLGDHESAVEPLKMAVDSNPDELEPYLDYAGALLTIQSQPDEAVRILRKAEQVSPNNPYTKALLAEALAEIGDLETSQQTFYQALQSDLSKDEQWHSRLSFGLGKVSLKLSQPETAIASLQESIRTNPTNPHVYKALAEAFSSLDLRDEALEAAQNALMHSPDDVDMLTWYASLATKLESLNEAITALEKYVDIKPNDTSMIVQLGLVQAKAGRENDARGTLKRVLSANDAETNHLHEAALGLLKLNDPDSAATFLERAISQSPEKDPHMLLDLANAYKHAGRSHQALETLDKAISIDTNNAETFLAKSDLLAELGRVEDMQDCLENALNLHPENPNLRYRLVHLLRSEGDLSSALSHAAKLVAVSRRFPSSSEAYTARTLAADLARASLKPTYARSFFDSQGEQKPVEKELPDIDEETRIPEANSEPGLSKPIEEHIIGGEPSALFSYYCLSAELALEEGEEIAAADALNQAIKYNPAHPRLLALQSRLANRRGDIETAHEIFHNACEGVRQDNLWSYFPDQLPDLSENKTDPFEEIHSHEGGLSNHKLQLQQDFVCTLLGISAAAAELGEWETGLNILKKVTTGTIAEPYTQLQVLRMIVLRAEYQSLCQTLDVVEHAPGNTALGKEAATIIQNASQDLEQNFSDRDSNDGEKSSQIIALWLKRGNSVFQTSQLPPFKTDLKPEEGSVIFENLSTKVIGQNKFAETQLADGNQDPLQKSLSLALIALETEKSRNQEKGIDDSIQTAKTAIDQYPKQPIFHALLAHLYKRSEDYTTALNSMLTALSIWPDEPRWQAMTAELQLKCGNTQTAIEHLYDAVRIEPGFMKHHLALGEALSVNGDHQSAIDALKQAHRLAPEKLEPNLALARAFIMNQDPDKALPFVEKARILSPDTPEPLQMLAEIALQKGEPKNALSNAKSALRLNPDHPDTLCLMARALSKMNQYDEALSVLETAAPLSPKPLPILIERAKLLETSQGADTALTALQQLVQEYPHDPVVLANLARNLAAVGQQEEAIQAAQTALQRRESGWEPGEQAKLHLLLGSLLRQSGQLDQAIHQLTEAIRLSPNDVEAYLELAATQQDRRQHMLALQTFQKAIEVAPNNPLPYYQTSLALKDGRDYEGAERMLRKAAHLAPDDLSIHRQLAALVALNLVHNQRSIAIET